MCLCREKVFVPGESACAVKKKCLVHEKVFVPWKSEWLCFMKIIFSSVKIYLVAAVVEIEILPWTIDFAVAVVGHRNGMIIFKDFQITLSKTRKLLFHLTRPILVGGGAEIPLPNSWLVIGRAQGGTCEDFDRDGGVIFWVSNLLKCHFWVSLSWRHFFWGLKKLPWFIWVHWKFASFFLGFWTLYLENYNLDQ